MRTIIHISDLHFGRIHAATLEPLAAMIHRVKPDLIAISGDLTQRARERQFEEARAFLDTLPFPQLVVPGNHDVPLYDLGRRVFFPHTRYHRHISRDMAPLFSLGEIAVAGLNTSRSFTFTGGRIRRDDIDRAAGHFEQFPAAVKLVVLHHPLSVPAALAHLPLVRHASSALERLAAAGLDVVLSGHLHKAGVERIEVGGRGILVVRAGTATSTRLREEPNAFNLLSIEGESLTAGRYEWDDAAASFNEKESHRFVRGANGYEERQGVSDNGG